LHRVHRFYAEQQSETARLFEGRLQEQIEYCAEQQSETALLFEGQLQEQMDISAGLREDASTITMGANILL
jgi:hypothetical protein